MPTLPRTPCHACREAEPIFAFTMAFQPVVDLQTSRVDAYEALVRGPNGESAAHILGQVNDTNRYAFDQACRVRAIELASRLGIDRRLNINFLPNAVYEPRACIQTTLEAAARTGFPRGQLTFEIVENETIADTSHLRGIIAEYHRCGFQVALDDFGTAYSGLLRLVELQPDIVKLDRALIQDCDTDKRRLALAAAMIALGRDLGIKIVIEGVEREGEVDALRSVGARFMQGYYFAEPGFESITADIDIHWREPAS
jgi:EAL domain-containing protein (putative c-di-GMP-specific phosphodiesterase class I)